MNMKRGDLVPSFEESHFQFLFIYLLGYTHCPSFLINFTFYTR